MDRASRFSTQAERLKNNLLEHNQPQLTAADRMLISCQWFHFILGFHFGSPLYFLFYLTKETQIAQFLSPNNRSYLICLLYADDLVFMQQSGEGLENALSILSEYREHWLSSLNPKKTKIMICEKKYRKSTLNKHCYHINRHNIRHCCCFGCIWVHL